MVGTLGFTTARRTETPGEVTHTYWASQVTTIHIKCWMWADQNVTFILKVSFVVTLHTALLYCKQWKVHMWVWERALYFVDSWTCRLIDSQTSTGNMSPRVCSPQTTLRPGNMLATCNMQHAGNMLATCNMLEKCWQHAGNRQDPGNMLATCNILATCWQHATSWATFVLILSNTWSALIPTTTTVAAGSLLVAAACRKFN